MANQKLPLIQHQDQNVMTLQSQWKKTIDPVVSNPSNQSQILSNVALINGSTTVNHKLGRKLIGYRIVGQSASASIHDNQTDNPSPQLTLILVSSAPVTVNIEVF